MTPVKRACDQCARKKIRCDRNRPCNTCLHRRIGRYCSNYSQEAVQTNDRCVAQYDYQHDEVLIIVKLEPHIW